MATQGPDGSWVPFLSGDGNQKWAEALLRGHSPQASQGSGTDAYRSQPKLAKAWAWLGDGGGVSLASPKPLMVDYSSSNPFPPAPQARLGAWPPVYWQDWGWGGRRGNFKLSGQNVKFAHEFTQQKEGEEARAGTPHARVLSVPTFLPHPPLQP